MFDNRYFEMIEPIRWFKDIGTAETNTYVGRSMALDRVREQSLANPGDQVHALVGGTFLVRQDGTVECGTLRLEKPLFEKSYGGHVTDAALLQQMAACGRCREIAAPEQKLDYGAARKALEGVRLPRLTGSVSKENVKRTPLMTLLVQEAAAAGLKDAAERAGGKLYGADVGMGREPDTIECSILVDIPKTGRISVIASPARAGIWVLDRLGGFADRVREAGDGLTPEFRNEAVTIFPAADLPRVLGIVAERLEALAELPRP